MVFKLFSRKKQPPRAEPDPLTAYDAFIEDLDRQGAEIRKSAAALIAMRGELNRSAERYQKRLLEVDSRKAVAHERNDHKALSTLERDQSEAQRLLESTRESLVKVEADAQLLVEASQELTTRAAELRAERTSAQARLSAGLSVTQALRDRSERISRALALDAARDEIERAHALADIYREERDKGG
jgi:phage shock protein A